MSLDDLENDILLNDKYNFTSMSYPYGQFNEEIQEILENKGYLNGFAKINNLKKWLRGI